MASTPVSASFPGPYPERMACNAHTWTHNAPYSVRIFLAKRFWDSLDRQLSVYPDMERDVGYGLIYAVSTCTPREMLAAVQKCIEAGEVVIPVWRTADTASGRQIAFIVFQPVVPVDWAIHILKHALDGRPPRSRRS